MRLAAPALLALALGCVAPPDEVSLTPSYGRTDYPAQTTEWDSSHYGVGLGFVWHLGSQKRAREAAIEANQKMDRLIDAVRFPAGARRGAEVVAAKPEKEAETDLDKLWIAVAGGGAALSEWWRRKRCAT